MPTIYVVCEHCNGTGRKQYAKGKTMPCGVCGGSGRVAREKK